VSVLGKGRNSGKNKSLDFSWLEGRYSCLKESGITTLGGIEAVVVENNVVAAVPVDDDLVDIDDGERCPTRARLLIIPALLLYGPESSPAGVAEIQDFLGEIQDEADVANIVAAVAAAAASVSGEDSSASGAVTFVAIFRWTPVGSSDDFFINYVFHGVGSFSGDDEITLYAEIFIASDDFLNNGNLNQVSDVATLKVTKSSKNGGTIAVDFYDSFWPSPPVETARSYLFVKSATMYPTSSPVASPGEDDAYPGEDDAYPGEDDAYPGDDYFY